MTTVPVGEDEMWEVRPEAPEDFGAVRVVHARAFAPSGVEADLVDALRAAGDLEEGLRRAAGTEFPLVVVVGHADHYPRQVVLTCAHFVTRFVTREGAYREATT